MTAQGLRVQVCVRRAEAARDEWRERGETEQGGTANGGMAPGGTGIENGIRRTRERVAQNYQLVKCYAGNGENWGVDGNGAGLTVRTAARRRGRVKTRTLRTEGCGTRLFCHLNLAMRIP